MRTSKNSPAEEAKRCRCLQEYLMYFFSSSLFNQTFIESLLTFSSACRFSGLSVKDKKNCLKNIVEDCIKITGARLYDLCSRWRRASDSESRRNNSPNLNLYFSGIFYSYALRSALLCAHTENKPWCKFINSFGNRATKFGTNPRHHQAISFRFNPLICLLNSVMLNLS